MFSFWMEAWVAPPLEDVYDLKVVHQRQADGNGSMFIMSTFESARTSPLSGKRNVRITACIGNGVFMSFKTAHFESNKIFPFNVAHNSLP